MLRKCSVFEDMARFHVVRRVIIARLLPQISDMHLRILLPLAILAGCGSLDAVGLSPYKIDVQQGNVLSQDSVAKLKTGMTPAQVRFLLGTPLVSDPFHPNRWDYLYRLEKGGKLRETRHVVVVFENDHLKGLEGDVVAAAVPDNKIQPEAVKP
jgi:outer membrane protein assembly factor BamE